MSEYDFDIPTRYDEAANVANAFPWFERVITDYLADPVGRRIRGEGLLLAGGFGTGKTWTAVALVRTMERLLGRRFATAFCHAADLVNCIYPVSGPESRVRDWDINATQVAETATVLIVDEFGHALMAGGMRNIVQNKFGRLLRQRCNKKLLTILTTNMRIEGTGPGSLAGELDAWIASTVDQLCPFQIDVGEQEDARMRQVRRYTP